MAAIKSEMPPLHAAEALAATAGSSATSGGGGSGGNSGADLSTSAAAVAASNSTNPSSNNSVSNNTSTGQNNTISAAADSSDNQPSTPQPQSQSQSQSQLNPNSNEQSSQQQQQQHHPYATHHMYASGGATTAAGTLPPHHMYGGIYASADVQQQHQHHQQQQQQQQQSGYPSYLNSYEQFYQQQQQQQQHQSGIGGMDYGSSASNSSAGGSLMYSNDYKSGIRYHPYLNTPTSGGSGSSQTPPNTGGSDEAANMNASSVSSVGNGGSLPAAVSTSGVMSPRVVSSTSPSSTSTHLQLSGSTGPGSPGSKLQCKKCGIMCTSEAELQEHITNVHGASPYGSSGYSSSPYIKDELPPPSAHSQQQQQQQSLHQGSGGTPSGQQQQSGGGGNPGDILDLDSQKMVYPPMMGHPHQQAMHDPVIGVSDPLHSMHSMQQRAMSGWDSSSGGGGSMQEGLPPYLQQQQQDMKSPYYMSKPQSPYHVGVSIKQEYPLIKSEYADSQNYVDKSFDPTVVGAELCGQPSGQQAQQQQQTAPMMPVSSSPAEFPSTTTGPQDQQQQYRGFEPPTSSSAAPPNNLSTKSAAWKSNEARRPKTYNCTACNKWFTSSGHLKRHYNTTLHKNAVKSSGQPDPATLPISVHHHPARDPVGKHSRRNNSAAAAAAAAAAQQQPPAPVQPPEPPESAGGGGGGSMGPMSQYSDSSSPTQQQQQQQANGVGMTSYAQQQNGYQPPQQSPYMQQVQSSTNASPQHASNAIAGHSPSANQAVMNGHPNGLAGPSAQTTPPPMPSSHTRGLLNTTTTTITKIEPMEDNNTHSPTAMSSSEVEEDHRDQVQDQEEELEEEEVEREMLHLQQQQQRRMVDEVGVGHHLPHHQQHRSAIEDHQGVEAASAHHQALLYQELEDHRRYHSSTPNSIRTQSPLIISHQQYQEGLQRQHLLQQQQPHQMGSIFSHTPLPPLQPQQPPAHMPHSIMEQQPQYNIIPLGINTPQQPNSSMQLLQQPQHIITSTATTDSMDSIHTTLASRHHHHHHHRETVAVAGGSVEQDQLHNTLLSSTNIQRSQLDITSTTLSTTIPQQQQLQPLQQPQHITNTIQSYQQPGSGLASLEPTMNYHTIIGSGNGGVNNNAAGNGSGPPELVQLTTVDVYGNFQSQQMLTTTTADGQILQFIPASQMMAAQPFFALPTRASVAETYAPLSQYTAQRSPQEADLPPIQTMTNGHMQTQESSQTLTVLPSMPYSPTITSSTLTTLDDYTGEGHRIKHDDMHGLSLVKEEFIINESAANTISTTTTTTTISTPSIAFPKSDEVGDGALAPPTSTTKKRKRPSSSSGGDTGNGSSTDSARLTKSQRLISGSSATTDAVASGNALVLPNGRIKCLLCDKEFTKCCYLTQHNKSFHSGEYPYRCTKCGKRFQEEDVYTTHVGRHKSEDKPHKCDLCPKQFHHKTDLRRHVEAIHTGNKQHVCEICDKSFCRKDHLRKHLETHSRPRVVSKKALKAMSRKPSPMGGSAAGNGLSEQSPVMLGSQQQQHHPQPQHNLQSDHNDSDSPGKLVIAEALPSPPDHEIASGDGGGGGDGGDGSDGCLRQMLLSSIDEVAVDDESPIEDEDADDDSNHLQLRRQPEHIMMLPPTSAFKSDYRLIEQQIVMY